MRKICIIIGTRPEAIKMAPVIIGLREYPGDFEVIVCSTGQHVTMLRGAMQAFNLQPDIEFDVMSPNQSLPQLAARLLSSLDVFLTKARPDLVLVHGDTTSTLMGAMAAFHHKIEVGHVEAGLRTNNLLSPFPEEYNRRSVTIAARYHFAPTPTARDNLEKEGVTSDSILVTGNTVIDALLLTIYALESNPGDLNKLCARLEKKLGFSLGTQPFVLITAHRRENFGVGLDNICYSITELAKANPSMYFVYPIHLNPQVADVVKSKLSGLTNVVLIPPQDYRGFAWLLRNCLLLLTDSGGIQEEAPAFGKPVLVMRDTSERPEAIEAGTAKLVTTDPNKIIHNTQILISNAAIYDRMSRAINPFGDGGAARRIVEYLLALECA